MQCQIRSIYYSVIFLSDRALEERRKMYPSSESACSCSTEGSVSHCSVLMSPTGGAREDMHVYKRHIRTQTQAVAHKHMFTTCMHIHTQPQDTYLESLTRGTPIEFHAKMALLMENRGYTVQRGKAIH